MVGAVALMPNFVEWSSGSLPATSRTVGDGPMAEVMRLLALGLALLFGAAIWFLRDRAVWVVVPVSALVWLGWLLWIVSSTFASLEPLGE